MHQFSISAFKVKLKLFLCKNSVFPVETKPLSQPPLPGKKHKGLRHRLVEVEYSYFSADFRLNIFFKA